MRSRLRRVGATYILPRILVTLILAIFGLAALACDPGHNVTYENRTASSLTIYVSGARDVSIKPFAKETSDLLRFPNSKTIEAKDETGAVVFSKTLTWDDLRRQGWKVIITEEAVPVNPAPTAS